MNDILYAEPTPPPASSEDNLLVLLVMPIVVALVTVAVTSALTSLRARSDRLAALRLETYQNLVLAARHWEEAFERAIEIERKDGKGYVDTEEALRTKHALREQMRLLPLVARERPLERIQGDYKRLNREAMHTLKESEGETFEGWSTQVIELMSTFIDGIVEEARREIRRTRV